MGVKTLVGLGAGLVAAIVLFVAVLIGGTSGAGLVTADAAVMTQGCASSGPVPGLDAGQARNARTVGAVASQLGGQRAALIAISVALAESGLPVLGNPNVATGDHPVQGVGSNQDSIGIFQQRASWGSVEQRLDPVSSTRLFVTALLADPGWQRKPPWVAAQDVQRSGYDGHPSPANHESSVYGGNYQATLAQAQRIVAVVAAGTGGCETLHGGTGANPAPGSHGLPVGYTIPASATPAEVIVIRFALAQLDKPYVFGAAGPEAFDCSGLTLAAWAHVGVSLPHWAVAQSRDGTPVNNRRLIGPGDLVFVPGDDGTLAAPGHVGIYIGDGLVENASDPSDGIRVQTYNDFVQVGHGLSAIRHIA